MKNYLINLACRGAGLGPWAGTRSAGHIRADSGLSLIHRLRPADAMAGPFETEASSLAGSEMPGELGDALDNRMARPETVSVATPADSVIPRSSVEVPMATPGRAEIPRPPRLQPKGPAVTGQQDMEIHTEVAPLETHQTRRTSQEQGPDIVVTSEKLKKQDTTGDGPYPVNPPRPVVDPTIMLEKTGFNKASRPLETDMQYIRKVSEHYLPGTLEKTMPLVRPSADSFSPLVAAAISGPQSTGPGERGRVTRPQQSVTVRIGRVEVRAVHEPSKRPLPRSSSSTPPQSGFDEYLSLRNYTYSEP